MSLYRFGRNGRAMSESESDRERRSFVRSLSAAAADDGFSSLARQFAACCLLPLLAVPPTQHRDCTCCGRTFAPFVSSLSSESASSSQSMCLCTLGAAKINKLAAQGGPAVFLYAECTCELQVDATTAPTYMRQLVVIHSTTTRCFCA